MNGNQWAPRQGPVMGRSMMVATAHPTASEAGLAVIRAGGNAVDAAVCVNWLNTVLKPARTHLGGDVFYLIYSAADGSVTAINGSGAAPSGATVQAYAGGIPERGIRSVAVPGFVDGVIAAHRQFGSMSMSDLMAPAIELAREGFPVSLRLADLTRQFEPLLRRCEASVRVFMPGGVLPRPGQTVKQPDLARSLEAIRANGRDGFYGGDFERALLNTCAAQGGHFAAGDLARHKTDVKQPIRAGYRGYTVYEQPPVSQGYILLEELGIIEGFDLKGRSPNDPDIIHLMVEAKKLAFADSERYGGDPDHSQFSVQDLFDADFLAKRRAAIDPARAADTPAAGALAQKVTDTTSFAVVDAQGNAVASIQSVFAPWGSGVVVEGTGVLLNNRLTGFSLEPGHANVLEPGKRPVHTLNQYIVTKDGKLVLVGGTPGGQMQVQTNMQVLSAVLDGGLDVQSANDLPRWAHTRGLELIVESRYDDLVYTELDKRGHRLKRVDAWDTVHGRAALIGIDEESGARMGAVDLRSEGHAAGW